ncbi:SDR family NAD(P)-dependent oxidoreductase [Nocardioides sp. YIM 152588]|uniref:SDR family NAD(P)-dependent oxidoreductase n=1 Tax=Nocardioides sp. YIM 152588 TaxID=3158259 RepID=UPI0032E45AB5
MTGRLEGRRCLVTGAAGGLGRTFCSALAAEGARVAGLDLADLGGTGDAVAAAGGRLTAVRADVTDPEQVQDAVDSAAAGLGGLDTVVNNAGVYPLVPFEATDFAQWRRIMAVNLDGLFLVTRAALPHLRRAPFGRIVNVASAVVWLGPPGMVAYTASKSGMVGFTRALASELGPEGITVNAMTPGMIATETAVATGVTRDLDRVVGGQAVPRAERPEDLVSTLLFLVDEGSSFVTGSAVNVDGGFAKH